MIYSYELEMQLLAALIKYPEKFVEIATFISEKDFWNESSKINRIIFKVLKQAIENG
jgi:replicative DNA helicase